MMTLVFCFCCCCCFVVGLHQIIRQPRRLPLWGRARRVSPNRYDFDPVGLPVHDDDDDVIIMERLARPIEPDVVVPPVVPAVDEEGAEQNEAGNENDNFAAVDLEVPEDDERRDDPIILPMY